MWRARSSTRWRSRSSPRSRAAALPKRRSCVTGGPLTFLPALRRALADALRVDADALVLPERGALACAEGAALAAAGRGHAMSLSDLRALVAAGTRRRPLRGGPGPLFENEAARAAWTATRFTPVPRVSPGEAGGDLFLGIDSGSTTTKLVLVDRDGRLVAHAYEMNRGEPLDACRRGLETLRRAFAGCDDPVVGAAAATGYGEDLVRAAFGIDRGLVETEAHLRAARALAPDASFVLDIGGQDMKALFVRRGTLDRIDVNEACSSGCGTFLQTFAEGLSLTSEQLADAACRSRAPRDLGSRCTVFMNSMVKQALREGAGLEDIAAGLAYSVARNCLQKVLKLRDFDALGDTIVAQGGTFLNPAVHRAFEDPDGPARDLPGPGGPGRRVGRGAARPRRRRGVAAATGPPAVVVRRSRRAPQALRHAAAAATTAAPSRWSISRPRAGT